MMVDAADAKSRWTIAGIGAASAAVLVVGLFMFSRISTLPPPVMNPPAPVKLADPSPANPLVRELTALRDLAPLFLPTDRNATPRRPAGLQTGRTLLEMEATKLSLAEAEFRFERDLPPAATLNGKPVTEARPADTLPGPATEPGALGFGRKDVPLEPVRARGGYLEVVAVGSGKRVLEESLDPSVKPPTEKPWAPVQFLASVNRAGLVGPLILAERSGVEEVDQHFRNFLAQSYRIGQRLPPGIYRIAVGP